MRRPDPETWVWLLLLAATALSWALSGLEGSTMPVEARSARLLILLVAFFKTRLVLLHFMEVVTAPVALRVIMEAWVVLTCGALIFQLW